MKVYFLILGLMSLSSFAVDIPLPAGESLKLSDDWHSYTSKKIINTATSYPFVEHKKLKGLLGVLDTEVKLVNLKKLGTSEKWFSWECEKLKDLYGSRGGKVSESKGICKVEVPATDEQKGMIQYLKAKVVSNKKPLPGGRKKIFVYTYNFYFPKKDLKIEDVEAEVQKLMDGSL